MRMAQQKDEPERSARVINRVKSIALSGDQSLFPDNPTTRLSLPLQCGGFQTEVSAEDGRPAANAMKGSIECALTTRDVTRDITLFRGKQAVTSREPFVTFLSVRRNGRPSAGGHGGHGGRDGGGSAGAGMELGPRVRRHVAHECRAHLRSFVQQRRAMDWRGHERRVGRRHRRPQRLQDRAADTRRMGAAIHFNVGRSSELTLVMRASSFCRSRL